MREFLIPKMAALAGIELAPTQLEQLASFVELLKEQNRVMNLTALKEDEDIAVKHILDCFMLLPQIPFQGKLIDVGTGAGFPGIILKIMRPDLEIVLLDALRKRISFLEQVITELGLGRVMALHERAEDLGRSWQGRAAFDLVTVRAVADLPMLLELTLPLLKRGGHLFAMKGPSVTVDPARRALFLLGGKITCFARYILPETEIERSLLVVEKVSSTPKIYPRPFAQIKQHPL